MVNVGSTSNEPTTDPTSSTAPPRDDQVKNNNWVDDNLVHLKNSFDVLKEQDSVLEHVIGTTCTPKVISSSSKSTSPSPMKNTPIAEKIWKLEKLIIDGKTTLVDDNGKPIPVADRRRKGNPIYKVGEVVDSDSDDEVFEPNDPMGSYFSSAGGHNELEGYISDDYAALVYDLPVQSHIRG